MNNPVVEDVDIGIISDNDNNEAIINKEEIKLVRKRSTVQGRAINKKYFDRVGKKM